MAPVYRQMYKITRGKQGCTKPCFPRVNTYCTVICKFVYLYCNQKGTGRHSNPFD